jgi:choline-sulfatase
MRARSCGRVLGLFVGFGAALCAAIGAGCRAPERRQTREASEEGPPNIVFVVTDDQAAWALGVTGNEEASTPHLDQLARGGARFTNSFVTTPVCSPSRVALITGRYGTEFDIPDFISGSARGFARGLAPTAPAWPRVLRQTGYSTALIGKWHLGAADEFHPRHFGYQEFCGFRHGGRTSQNPVVEIDGVAKERQGWTPDLLTDYAIDFIRRERDGPFLVSLHFWAPHANGHNNAEGDRTWLPLSDADWTTVRSLDPALPEPQYPRLDTPRAKRMMREYLGSVASVDRNMGRLLKELEELGIGERTVVIFTSDHGFNMGHHGLWHKGNGRWLLEHERGSRPNLFDTSLRVPTVVRWPHVVTGGTVVTDTISQLDWYPTLLAIAGVAPEGETRGRSLVPLLRGEKVSSSHELFVQYSMRHATHADLRGYRTPEWKLVRDFLRPGQDELYDLRSDPGETRNLIGSSDTVVLRQREALHAKLIESMRNIDDPLLAVVPGEPVR